MSIPLDLCPRTLRWLADEQQHFADSMKKSVEAAPPQDDRDAYECKRYIRRRALEAQRLRSIATRIERRRGRR